MREVIYQHVPQNRIFTITENEFKVAMIAWMQGRDYYCERLEALLPPRYKWVEKPREDKGWEVFISYSSNGYIEKIFKRGDNYYKIFNEHGCEPRKVCFPFKEEAIKRFIPQEDYYKKQMYLISPKKYENTNKKGSQETSSKKS